MCTINGMTFRATSCIYDTVQTKHITWCFKLTIRRNREIIQNSKNSILMNN